MGSVAEIVFRIGLAMKGIDSLMEVVGGILLSMPTRLARYVTLLAEHEVYRHHDALAGRLDHIADAVAMRASMVEALYLVVHGLAKAILIYAVFKNKKWGYSGLVVVLTVFTVVELTRAITAREVFTAVFGVFDLALAALLWKERETRFPSTGLGDGSRA